MHSRDLTKLILNDGWELVRVKGSHHQYKHSSNSGTVTIPHPKADLPQ